MTTIDSLDGNDAAPLFLTPLPEFAVFRVTGADAASFLHGQLTQDIEHLGPAEARLAGYCSPKGRLLVSLLVWRSGEQASGQAPEAAGDILLLARGDAADALTRRLAMFILRAKAKISASPQAVYGASVAAEQLTQAEQLAGGSLPQTPWQKADLPSGTWIALPQAPAGPLQWFVLPVNMEAPVLAGAQTMDAETWYQAHLGAGIPWIGGATADLFVPQNVNFDCIGGINFRKGCYPGQEVVARSHYRGTLKRRMGYGTLNAAPTLLADPAADVFDPARPQEPAGRVVASAPGVVLLEAPLDVLAAGELRYGAVDGPAITIGSLPYPLEKPEN
ncbi:YgfZ/GcvT domain-containing protein [Kerstersia similis]|uniref:CAF17-like 4Fe-4S cluster assembly/insertion protein YgfZ n=1 Tax=Kerstersia similis TaxID=206505 RepID=UPI0039F0456C